MYLSASFIASCILASGTLKKCVKCLFWQLITDVNIAVAVEAIQAIGNLARGLRTNFSSNSRYLLPVLLVCALTPFIGNMWD